VEILYVMIPLGLVLVGFGLWAFFWRRATAVRRPRQPGWTVLEDDQTPPRATARQGRQHMMNPESGALSLGAALLAGLAASGHCIGMCGGIAGALAMRRPSGLRTSSATRSHTTSLGSRATRSLVHSPGCSAARCSRRWTWLRSPSRSGSSPADHARRRGALLFGWRLLDPLESAGARLWRRVAPWAGRQGRSGSVGARSGSGSPGLAALRMTYSMLLLAATTASVPLGATVMLAFGVGTLPRWSRPRSPSNASHGRCPPAPRCATSRARFCSPSALDGRQRALARCAARRRSPPCARRHAGTFQGGRGTRRAPALSGPARGAVTGRAPVSQVTGC